MRFIHRQTYKVAKKIKEELKREKYFLMIQTVETEINNQLFVCDKFPECFLSELRQNENEDKRKNPRKYQQ